MPERERRNEGSYPFTRAQRLTKGAQFKRVFAAPRRSSDRMFTVLAADNDIGTPRLGLAIGKKRMRRAVMRNRIKRLAREAFRHQASRLGGIDVVVISRFDGRASNVQISQSLNRHLQRLAAAR